MDIAQVLKILDELLFEKTGSHLDFIQKSVLEGTLQDKTYSEIAVKRSGLVKVMSVISLLIYGNFCLSY